MSEAEFAIEMARMSAFMDWLGPYKLLVYFIIVAIIAMLIIPTEQRGN